MFSQNWSCKGFGHWTIRKHLGDEPKSTDLFNCFIFILSLHRKVRNLGKLISSQTFAADVISFSNGFSEWKGNTYFMCLPFRWVNGLDIKRWCWALKEVPTKKAATPFQCDAVVPDVVSVVREMRQCAMLDSVVLSCSCVGIQRFNCIFILL